MAGFLFKNHSRQNLAPTRFAAPRVAFLLWGGPVAKKNRRVSGGFQESVAYLSAYARISLPPEALENQK